MKKKSAYWFPVKLFGWGWGLPVTWQGWLVLIGYVALHVLGVRFFRTHDLKGIAIYLGILTAVFITVVVAKGEKPAGWRWGRR